MAAVPNALKLLLLLHRSPQSGEVQLITAWKTPSISRGKTSPSKLLSAQCGCLWQRLMGLRCSGGLFFPFHTLPKPFIGVFLIEAACLGLEFFPLPWNFCCTLSPMCAEAVPDPINAEFYVLDSSKRSCSGLPPPCLAPALRSLLSSHPFICHSHELSAAECHNCQEARAVMQHLAGDFCLPPSLCSFFFHASPPVAAAAVSG